MTSSTSNSDPVEPKWGQVWALTFLVVATIVGAWELIVRDADLGPRYVDNKVLWADTRHRLNEEGDDAIVLIGASRMLRGVNVETMQSEFDRPVYQLSVEGTSSLPLLQNLGADPRIRGSVVVSIAPAFTFNRLLNQGDMGIQSIYLDYYDSQSYARRLEQRLRMWAQGKFAFRSPDSKLAIVIPELLTTGSLPAPNWQRMFRDRSVHMDYAASPIKQTDTGIAARYLENNLPYTDDEFRQVVNYIETIVQQLNAKGVDVYFVRLPSAGAVNQVEGAYFPRERYWDVLKNSVDATFIHFEEYPELHGYLSEDGSHVDSKDSAAFTKALSDVLQRNNLHVAPAGPPDK